MSNKDSSEPTESSEPSKDLSTELQSPEPEVDNENVPEPDVETPTLAGVLVGIKRPWYKRLWQALTGTKKRLALSIFGLIIIAAVIIGLTPLKYPVVGLVIKSQISVVVSDNASGQLLPGTSVMLNGASATTDKIGVAHFTGLKPGNSKLIVTKPAYNTDAETFTLGFGDQGTRQVKLTSNGIKVSFKLTNYVSGKPVTGARVRLGDADAVSDAAGNVTTSLTPAKDGQSLTAAITTDGFNDASVAVNVKVGLATITTKLVPAGQVYYLSNRSGKVDLYGANLDGSGAAVLLAGTGKEDQSTGILPNVYDQSNIALVSSRAGKFNGTEPQEDLYLFKPASKQLTQIDSNITFGSYRTWLGKTLVYQKNNFSGNTNTSSIQAYDPATAKNTTLVTCTEDGACPQALYSTDDLFLYSLSGALSGSSSNGVFAVKAGSISGKSISATPASTTIRQTKDAVLLQYYNYNNQYPNGAWQSVNLDTTKATSLPVGPANTATRTYIDSPGDKLSASIDNRDGQSDLYLTNTDGTGEHQLTTTGKVSQFVQWFGDSYIVYSSDNQLFVVAVDGGDPQKITNFYSGVVNVYGGGYNPGY